MTRHPLMRRWKEASMVYVAVALTAALWVAAARADAGPTAQAARTVNVSERASLHLVKKSGSMLQQEGTASGTFPGKVKARLNVTVLKVTGTVTFYPRGGGSLTFQIEGFPRSTGVNAKFGGSMRVTGGTGRFARARGSASFSGTVNRRSWAATVNATGRLTY